MKDEYNNATEKNKIKTPKCGNKEIWEVGKPRKTAISSIGSLGLNLSQV